MESDSEILMDVIRRLRPSGTIRHTVRDPLGCDGLAPTVAARAGLTILELLVATAIVTLLTAIVLPACAATREAARHLQCSSQLRQLGLAIANYHDGFRCLPTGWQWEPSQQSAYGWAVPLLPYLEQQPTYESVNRSQSLQCHSNAEARGIAVLALRCPSDIADDTFELFDVPASSSAASRALLTLPAASFAGVFGTTEPDDVYPAPPGEGAFLESRPVRLQEFERGLSNTFLVGERTAARLPVTWLGVERNGEDAVCRLVGNAATHPNCEDCDECEFASRHTGGVNFLWGDGHVSIVANKIDVQAYRQLACRANAVPRN